jgi:structure-specific recognition protein 1
LNWRDGLEDEDEDPLSAFDDSDGDGDDDGEPREKKDPNAPKRANSAFMFYAIERHPTLKEENPEWAFSEFGKALGTEWGQMSEREKVPYAKQNEKDRERYDWEMASH